MLIRNQNKEVLVNFDVSAGIEIAGGTTKTVITSYITGCSFLLGEYSTKANQDLIGVHLWTFQRKTTEIIRQIHLTQDLQRDGMSVSMRLQEVK